MAVTSIVKKSNLARGDRIDAEYYQPFLLRYSREVAQSGMDVRPLGDLVADGYRVVYENTEIFDKPPDNSGYVRFLQAADVSSAFPTVSADSMGWVTRRDWDRYVKGRVAHGELLVEVKGKAEKVAIVPDDFPVETLITGTLYKFKARERLIDPHYLLCYLLSRYGRGFRSRCLTNTLIGFVSKEELYQIPVPVPSRQQQRRIAEVCKNALAKEKSAHLELVDAERLLIDVLGLDERDLSPKRFYARPFSDTRIAARIDAEYFSPRYQRILDKLRGSGQTIGDVSSLARRKFEAMPGVTFQYIEIGGLTGDGEARGEPLDGADAPSRAQWVVQPGDVITSTVRPIRRLSALVGANQAGYVCSSGFAVLRPTGIEPEVLLTYLRIPIICEILDLHTTASMYPAISEERLLGIPITLPSKSIRSRIVEKVKASIAARHIARRLLEDAKGEVERLIVGSDQSKKV